MVVLSGRRSFFAQTRRVRSTPRPARPIASSVSEAGSGTAAELANVNGVLEPAVTGAEISENASVVKFLLNLLANEGSVGSALLENAVPVGSLIII